MVATQGQQAAINDAVALATAGQQESITAAVALATQMATILAQNVYLPSPPEVEFYKVTKQFLNNKLPRCIGEPTYQHYIEAHNCLYQKPPSNHIAVRRQPARSSWTHNANSEIL